jgi:predicted SAM-dependent methyltransferase
MENREIKYLLGAGEVREEGFITVDLSDKCGCDIVADVRVFPWDWMPDGVDMIKSQNLLEHLTEEERVKYFNEAHRKLKVGGILYTLVPLLMSPEDSLEELKEHLMAAFTDPTHKSYWSTQTIDYFNKDHQRGKIYGRDYNILPWEVVRNEKFNRRFLITELRKPKS